MNGHITIVFYKLEPIEALAIVHLGHYRVSGRSSFQSDQQHSENNKYSDSDLKNGHTSGWTGHKNNLGSWWHIALFNDLFKIKAAKGK